jgi:hypothetical protein
VVEIGRERSRNGDYIQKIKLVAHMNSIERGNRTKIRKTIM